MSGCLREMKNAIGLTKVIRRYCCQAEMRLWLPFCYSSALLLLKRQYDSTTPRHLHVYNTKYTKYKNYKNYKICKKKMNHASYTYCKIKICFSLLKIARMFREMQTTYLKQIWVFEMYVGIVGVICTIFYFYFFNIVFVFCVLFCV